MTVSIGIVGAGKIVEDSHLPALLNIPEASVKWISDVSASRTALLARMYGVPVASIEKLDARLAEVDVCLLAVPVGVRGEYMERCAQAGVAVFAEKPFARNAEEHRRYASLFPPHRVAVGFQRRFYLSTAAVGAALADGLFGRLLSIDFRYGAYNLKTGGAGSYVADATLSGGGMIIESAIHGLDQIIHATDAQSVAVRSARSVVFRRADFDTFSDAELTIHGRAVPVTCEITRLRNLVSRTTYRFEGAMMRQGVGAEVPVTVASRDADGGARFSLVPAYGAGITGARTVAQATILIWRAFLDALRTERANASSALSSLLTTSWVDGIHERIVHD